MSPRQQLAAVNEPKAAASEASAAFEPKAVGRSEQLGEAAEAGFWHSCKGAAGAAAVKGCSRSASSSASSFGLQLRRLPGFTFSILGLDYLQPFSRATSLKCQAEKSTSDAGTSDAGTSQASTAQFRLIGVQKVSHLVRLLLHRESTRKHANQLARDALRGSRCCCLGGRFLRL